MRITRRQAAHIDIFPARVRARRSAFTLVEVLVVIGIILLLIGIVSFSIVRSKERARDTAVLSAARTIATDYVIPQTGNFDLTHRWGAVSNKSYLNGKLVSLLQNVPYDNIYRFANPYSRSRRIVNGTSVTGSNSMPAFFITNSNTYAYDRIAARTVFNNLKGSVVIYTKNGISTIDCYYIDRNGKKSNARWGNS